MTDSTKSKPSTGSGIATARTDLRRLWSGSNASHLMDLYWGGPERRITGLTLRIIGVNAVALAILMFGVLYLGRYQGNLIETTLETFQGDVELIAAGMDGLEDADVLSSVQKIVFTRSFQNAATGPKRLMIFDEGGNVLADTKAILGSYDLWPEDRAELQSIQTLKDMAGFVLKVLPDQKALPRYPDVKEGSVYPDVLGALEGRLSLSAWLQDEGRIFLSAAAPVMRGGKVQGAVLLTREARDIEREVTEVWIDMLRIFLGTLIITVLLSVYLSNVIAQPLRKLARAAEAVRLGKSGAGDIPDFRERKDEIGELSIVLRDMTAALSERLDTIEKFSADVAHELKNPLTSLRSAVETLGKVRKKEDRQKLLDILQHDVERMDRLISDISASSRLDTDLTRERFAPVNVKALLHDLVGRYQGPLEREASGDALPHELFVRYEDFDIALTFPETGSFYTFGIEGRLLQVFENLLANGLSFSPKGGKISIDVKALPNELMVSVRDQGPGIPEAKLENIFERFYSERPATEDYGRHSGLGLSICRQIMDVHQGRIFAENVEESSKVTGAQFTVVLNRI